MILGKFEFQLAFLFLDVKNQREDLLFQLILHLTGQLIVKHRETLDVVDQNLKQSF
jgi:hypothetical protein